MSKHRRPRRVRTTIRRNTWPDEDRMDYDQVLATVTSATKDTTLRIDRFEQLLNDGLQAHRIWARDVERGIRRDGLGAEIRRYEQRMQPMRGHNGELLTMPGIQSVRVRTDSGETYFQRELIELCSRDQITAKRTEVLRLVGTYSAKIAHYDKLLALPDMCPEADTPASAAAKLGMTVSGWLTGGKAQAA